MPAPGRIESILFFGTPEFALPTLAALVEAGREPVRVITRPAKPSGRGRKMAEPPVAAWARRHGLPVSQPPQVRAPEFLAEIAALQADLAVVVAFGQIFPGELLRSPRHGCVNLHASLLPRWRGAAPIQASIAAGDSRTGVTTMRMDEGLDTGAILLQEDTAILPRETSPHLSARLAKMGADLMLRTIEGLEGGALESRPQAEDGATHAPRIRKTSGVVDWSLTAEALCNRLQAYDPWPGLEAKLRGDPVKIVDAHPADLTGPSTHVGPPGAILGLDADAVAVACGAGTVMRIDALQRSGRKVLAGRDFWNGERLRPGERFE